jgi:hypothetical protein
MNVLIVYYRLLVGAEQLESSVELSKEGVHVALVVCRMCRRAFTNAQGEEVCPDCTARLNTLYPTVRNFLRNHENESYTLYEVSRLLGLDIKDVEGLVFLDLIGFGAHTRRNTEAHKTAREIENEKEKEKNSLTKRKTSGSVYLSRKKKP